MDINNWIAGIDYPEWQTEEAVLTLSKGYLAHNETPMSMYARLVARSMELYRGTIPDDELATYGTVLFKAFTNGWFSPATPVAANFGSRKKDGSYSKNFPVSCFSLHADNSVDSIYRKLHESAMLSKRGGGLGVYMGDVIGSTPLNHWMRQYDEMANRVSQGFTRRGSVALYTTITHPDLAAVLRSKQFANGGDVRDKIDSNIAVTIDNEFMEKVLEFDTPEFDTFTEVLNLRLETGSPYLMFTDNANDQAVDIYKDKGMKISTSNLCLAGNTKILTKDGFEEIRELVGKTVTIWDGNDWVENSDFNQLGMDNLYRVHLENGSYIDATLDHHWYVYTKKGTRRDKSTLKCVKTNELRIGDYLEESMCPDVVEVLSTIDNEYPTLVFKEAIENTGRFPDDITSWCYFDKCAVLHYLLNNFGIKNNDIYTICCASLFGTDHLDNSQYDVFYFLKSMGINSTIIAKRVTPNPEAVRQAISILGKKWGSSDEKVALKRRSIDTNYQKTKIVALEDLRVEAPVYCTTVPTTNKFALASGAMTGNCNEIYQFTDKDHTFTCVLSSLNVYKYDEWKDYDLEGFNVVKAATYFLDSVCEEFIQKAKTAIVDKEQDVFEYAYNSAVKGRALGLGTMGLHAYYMKKGYAFASDEARVANIEIHKQVYDQAYAASKDLAKILGEPLWCKGYGRRNSVLLAIAPTTTNSLLSNAVTPGIEPIHGNIYAKIGAKGTFVRTNPEFIAVLEKYGQHNQDVLNAVTKESGSVQKLDFLSEHEKEVFKIFSEIDPFEIVRQAADRQKYIDQGQSVNLYLKYDEPLENILAVHIYAWKAGLKGLYYVRSNSATKKSTKNMVITQADTTTDSSTKVVIYSREDCVYCNWAKQLLGIYNISYDEINQPEGTVPRIYINGEFLGGCNELYDLYQAEKPWDEEECSGCTG